MRIFLAIVLSSFILPIAGHGQATGLTYSDFHDEQGGGRTIKGNVELKTFLDTLIFALGITGTDPGEVIWNPEDRAPRSLRVYSFRGREYKFQASRVDVTDGDGEELRVLRSYRFGAPDEDNLNWFYHLVPSLFVPQHEGSGLPVFVLGQVFDGHGYQRGCMLYTIDGEGMVSEAGYISLVVRDPFANHNRYPNHANHQFNCLKQVVGFSICAEGVRLDFDTGELYNDDHEREHTPREDVWFVYSDGQLKRVGVQELDGFI
ncbi:MAG: hypothetical protein LUD76_10770 [Alistipes sp.]|nr:hypothetical protein [Alistipes sp.]